MRAEARCQSLSARSDQMGIGIFTRPVGLRHVGAVGKHAVVPVAGPSWRALWARWWGRDARTDEELTKLCLWKASVPPGSPRPRREISSRSLWDAIRHRTWAMKDKSSPIGSVLLRALARCWCCVLGLRSQLTQHPAQLQRQPEQTATSVFTPRGAPPTGRLGSPCEPAQSTPPSPPWPARPPPTRRSTGRAAGRRTG